MQLENTEKGKMVEKHKKDKKERNYQRISGEKPVQTVAILWRNSNTPYNMNTIITYIACEIYLLGPIHISRDQYRSADAIIFSNGKAWNLNPLDAWIVL